MAPSVKAVPGAVALGEVRVGDPCHEQIRFSSRSGEIPSVEAVETPVEVTARVDRSAEPLLDLTILLGEPGIWQGVVKVKLRIGSRSESVEIPCAAFVKAR
jgi:hypothetical protein